MADGRAMVNYVWWRIVHGAFVVLGAILVSFMLTSLSGDAAQARLGLFASGAQLRRMRVTMGLDKPLVERFVTYVAHAATGNFGASFSLQKPALGVVLHEPQGTGHQDPVAPDLVPVPRHRPARKPRKR